MNSVKRICLFILAILYCSFPIYANDFQADYDTQYAISPNGKTIVTQNVTLTNKQSNLYPKQYTVTIDSDEIRNVIAYDTKGVITPKVAQISGMKMAILQKSSATFGKYVFQE